MGFEKYILIVIFSLLGVSYVYASFPATPYAPGETIEPECSPGENNCTVSSPAISGANSDITSLAGLTTALSVAQGGTGLASIAADSIIYSSDDNILAALAFGDESEVLKMVDGVLAWSSDKDTTYSAGTGLNLSEGAFSVDTSAIALTDLTGVLSVTQGGTGLATIPNNSILYTSALNTISSIILGDEGEVLKIVDGNLAWGAASDNSYTAGAGLSLVGTAFSLLNSCTEGQILAWDDIEEDWICVDLTVGDGTISTAKLADDAVTADKISDSNVTAAKLATGAVTSVKISDGTIVNADISASAAIVFSKLNIVKSDITGLGIPDVDTDTTYTVGSGLSLVGTQFNLLNTCSDTQVLKWDNNVSEWACNDDLFGTGLQANGTEALTADWDAGGYEIRAQTFESDVVTGTAPFTLASTTKVNNLNCDLLDGVSSTGFFETSDTIPVSAGGTGTATVFTQGSLTFAGASGLYSQDNNNLFWDDTANELGIGTNSPSSMLDVNGRIAAVHLKGVGVPTIEAGAGAGSSPTLSVSGSDIAGVAQLTTGTSTDAASTIFTVSFANAYDSNPYVVFAPANAATALLSNLSMVYVSSSTSGFSLVSGTSALTILTTYKWNYFVIE